MQHRLDQIHPEENTNGDANCLEPLVYVYVGLRTCSKDRTALAETGDGMGFWDVFHLVGYKESVDEIPG